MIDKEDKEKTIGRSWHAMTVGYIGSPYKTEGVLKELYLHNLVMNRLEFDGKGSTETVDHINGNSSDNSLENLRMICPNCHSQTTTYKNRNKGKGRHYRRKRYSESKSY